MGQIIVHITTVQLDVNNISLPPSPFQHQRREHNKSTAAKNRTMIGPSELIKIHFTHFLLVIVSFCDKHMSSPNLYRSPHFSPRRKTYKTLVAKAITFTLIDMIEDKKSFNYHLRFFACAKSFYSFFESFAILTSTG